jgi:predicted TIM-barrel fold metal-dependent hydrolase
LIDRNVLRALAERDIIVELLAHPDQLEEAASAFTSHPELTVVVEHAGWPRSDDPTSSRSGSAASVLRLQRRHRRRFAAGTRSAVRGQRRAPVPESTAAKPLQ